MIRPIVLEIKTWIEKAMFSALPSALFGKALANQWPKPIHFFDYPDLPPETNRVENAIHLSVIGQKKLLFSATDDGAKSSAFFYSMIETRRQTEKIHTKYYAICLWVSRRER